MAILRKSVVWLLIATQLWMPGLARAQIQQPSFPITVDKSGGSTPPPVVGVSGNGVPVVNIAPPSNSGVSNNRYTHFNVGPTGVILNNSGTSSQTQLGGSIGGNALLGRTPAKVILNQVTAANPSQLLGTLEVAVGRANVIVANPAGITWNGCGFLNANRATLTTGRPMMGEDGSLRGFDVAGGTITFNGQGLDGTNLNRVDIWARSLALNAQVWADHLDIVAGVASVDYLSGNASEKNNPSPAPAFALDVAALGGMYANSIRLVGTEAGLGVNVGGNLAAANRLELTAQGDVRIAPAARVQAAGPISLHTASTLANSGAITAGGGLIAKGQQLKNSGTITAGNAKKSTAGMQLMFADQHHVGTLNSAGDTTVNADRLNVDSGLISAKGALTLTTSGLMKHGNAEIHGHTVALQASALHSANGKIKSDTDLKLSVDGLMRNQGGTLKAKRDLSLVAGNWDNTGLIHAGQDLSLRSDRAHNRQTGQIIGRAKTSVQSDVLTNAGLIQAAKDLDVRSKRVDMQQAGRIVAGAQSDLHIDTLDNAGLIQAGQDLNLRGDRIDNQHTGQIVAGAKAELHSKVLRNAGLIDSGMTRLDAGDIVNTGEIYGDAIAIPANSLRNGRQGDTAGVIEARGDLDLGVTSLINQDNARIHAAGDLRLGGELNAAGRAHGIVRSVENTSAVIEAEGDAAINAATIKNRGGVVLAKGALALTTSALMEHSQAELRGNTVDLQAAVLHVSDSKIESDTDLQLRVDGLMRHQGSTLKAQRDLTLDAGQLDNSGLIHADQDLNLRGDSFHNQQAGRILAGAEANLHSNVLNNAGLIQAAQDLSVYGDRVDNRQTGHILAGAKADLHSKVLNNTGLIHAAQDSSVYSDHLDNQQTGRVLAGAQAKLHSKTLNNTGLIDSQMTQLVAGNVVNTGKIYGDAIAIQANSLRNDKQGAMAGVIAARGDLDLGVAALVNREHALIYVGGDLRLGGELDAEGHAQGAARSVENASATIDVAGDAVIRSASVKNLNNHYESELTEVSRENKAYYIPDQTTTMMPAAEAWLCHVVTGQCSQDFNWLGNDGRKQLLLPSDRYPVSRYGPPFTYSSRVSPYVGKGLPGVDGPVALNYYTETYKVTDSDWEDSTRIATRYKPGEKIWSVFEVKEPKAVPEPVMITSGRFRGQETEASKQLRASITASNDVLHKALDAEIRAFNQDFYGRLRDRIYFVNVNEVTIEDRVTKTDPGKILFGGNATIQGAVFNDKSQIAAAGALRIDGPAMVNQSARSTQRIEQTGTSIYTEWHRGRYYSPSTPYTNTFSRDIEPKAAEPQRGTPHKFPAATLVEVSMPGEGGVRVPIMPPVVPDNAMFRVNQVADASYLVSVDAQFLSPRHATSSPEARSLVALVEPLEGVADSARVSTLPPVMPGDVMSRLASETGAPRPAANDALVQEPRNAVSSNELLRALNADTTHILKRLGDGLYEQQLIAQQILLAKGQRLTGDYTSGQAQYRALLLAGAEFANQHKLTIGAALTEAQMRVLTSDIVWLVEQTIVLPDGSAHKVLSPQVYLVVKPTDLKGDGTLIAGRELDITSRGAINNSGTLVAAQRANLQAKTIQNTVGAMQAGNLALNAKDDILNQSGRIQGDTVSLIAGRDVTLNSEATRFAGSNVNNSAITGVSRLDAGELTIKAGRDLNAQAAVISASGDATLQAGRNVNLTTLTESFHMSWQANARNKGKLGVSEEHGTQLSAGGKLALLAGQDVTTRAASINVEQALSIGAGRDITLGAGERTEYSSTELFSKRKRFLSRSSRHTIRESSTTQAQGTSVNADSVTMMAGRNTNILGSDVAVEHDQLISAGQDLTIAAAQNTFENFNYERHKKSGLLSGGGGLSISIGTQENGQKNRSVVTQAAPSTVGSIQGDLRLIAGNDYVQTGSNVLALNGNIDILGRNVTIQEAREARTQTDQSWFKKTGLTIGVSNPVVSLAQTASDMAKAAGKTSDGRMKLLAAATVGLAGKNAYDATNGGDPAAVKAVNISISLGTSKSSSQSISTSDMAAGSTVLAGGDLTLLASGAGHDSDITVTGSKLSAGGNAILKADGDILLQAAKNVSDLHSSNKSSGGSIGVGVSVGPKDIGVSVSASAHTGRGKADGVDAIWTNTQINAGHVLALQSGEDTTLRGASGRAERVVASVGGKLLIESLQDTSAYKSKNQNASASVSVCVAGACGNSISGNVSQTKMNSDFASVIEQSGLWAGNGGFQIDVDKTTSLVGGLIASNDQAIRDGLNRLDTGTLVVKDIENKAEYSASSVGVGGGYSFGGGSQTKNDLGVNQKGEVAAGANAVPGTSVPKDRNGLSVGMPMVAAASGSARSMTLSAISEGQIRIRDEAGQQALTGKTAAETIAGLNRDTEDTLNSLSPIFNKEEIEAGFEIVGALTREAGLFLTNRANETEAVRNELDASIVEELAKGGDPERLAQLDSQWKAAGNWAPGGLYRQITTALLGAAGGNVTGSTGQFVQSAAVNYLQSEGAKLVKDFVASKPEGLEAEGVRAALHAIVGCAGAAAQNANCASGAAGAGLGSLFNSLMADDKQASAEEKEARNNLINALVAGVVTGLGGDAAAASTAARIETENNALYAKSKEVSKVLTPKVQELEQAFIQGEIDTQEYQRQRSELDILAAKVNGLAIVYGYRDGSGLAQSLSEMSVEHVNMLGEIVVGFLNVPGMTMSAYELITGKTVATDEEANSFFAALGILPGVGAAKAALGLRALSKADDVRSVAALKKMDVLSDANVIRKAPLPEGYREGASIGAMFNATDGLPDGYRRVINNITGDIEILGNNGKIFVETKTGYTLKEGVTHAPQGASKLSFNESTRHAVDADLGTRFSDFSDITARGSLSLNLQGSGGMVGAQKFLDSLPAVPGSSRISNSGTILVTLSDGSIAALYPVSTSSGSPSIEIFRPNGSYKTTKIRF